VSGADTQSAAAVWGIRFMMGVSPVLALLLGVWALNHYPIRHSADKMLPAVA